MRTTIRIDDGLLAEAKAFAARHRRSLNSVVEDALRQMLNRDKRAGELPRVELVVFSGEPGYQPWIDPTRDIKDIAHDVEVKEYLEARRLDEAG